MVGNGYLLVSHKSSLKALHNNVGLKIYALIINIKIIEDCENINKKITTLTNKETKSVLLGDFF